MSPLHSMQSLLAGLYDAPVEYMVDNFLFCDRGRLAEIVGDTAAQAADEQVCMIEDERGGGVSVGLFIDEQVLERLARRDPSRELDEENLHDYCTALEGVSHFHYLMWSLAHGRSVSLLELELQAEVDKYVAAVALMTRQRAGNVPHTLHARLFDAVSFLPQLDEAARRRYQEANRSAARYCRALDERFLSPRRLRPEGWLAELRRFFRRGHQEKIRQLML